jgi:hypothetical protein
VKVQLLNNESKNFSNNVFRKTYKYKSFKLPCLTLFVKANLLTDNKNILGVHATSSDAFISCTVVAVENSLTTPNF